MTAIATKELTLHLPAELVERILETATRRGQQPDEIVAEILGVSLPSHKEPVGAQMQQEITAETIAQELMAQGLDTNQIVMPGGAKDIITYIADDFDAPLDAFEDYR